jgi:LacI family transcriptional regulator
LDIFAGHGWHPAEDDFRHVAVGFDHGRPGERRTTVGGIRRSVPLSVRLSMSLQGDISAKRGLAGRRDVAIVMETSTAFSRGALAGVARWMADHDGWAIAVDDRRANAAAPRWLLRWQGDGLLSGVDERALPRPWRGGLRPVIQVRGRLTPEQLPGVYPDEDAAMQLAAAHLTERGLSRLAFCPSDTGEDRDRCIPLARYAESRGCGIDVYESSRMGVRSRLGDEADRSAVGKWIAGLPKPVGVIAASDVRAVQILEACREVGVAVPDDVAVVGIGDDDVLCDLVSPALTSVTHDRTRIGYEAARMLDERMHGRMPAVPVLLLPPRSITVRHSSDVFAVEDADVRQALRLIQARGCSGLVAADVATAVGLPRRLLDRKFQRFLGRTIHDELLRMKLAEAKRLLVETDEKLLVVSAHAGFSHAAQLCNVFKAAVGVPPMQFRKAARTNRKAASGHP